MLKNIKKSDLLILVGLFFIAFIICLASSLNPFGLSRLGSDTSVYLTIARGITQGDVPYRDFFDNKGPLLYLINAMGMLLGFTGVWLLEIFLMFISVYFAYKIALFFLDKFCAFSCVSFSFIVLIMFLDQPAGAEEYALPFMLISFYIFTKYYYKEKKLSMLELITLGLCFGVSMFIRINFFPLWLVFCILITIETVLSRNLFMLLRYIICFIIGILIVVIPVILYLYLNNALSDYIGQNFISGTARGIQGASLKETAKSFFIIIGKHFSFIPLIIGTLWIIRGLKSKYLLFYIGFVLAYLLSVFFHAIIEENFDHYNMVLIPFFIPSLSFIINLIYNYFNDLKNKKIAFLFFLCVIFAGQILTGFDDILYRSTGTTRMKYIEIGKIIEENTTKDDTIISLGFSNYIYLFVDRKIASKYFYQLSGAEYYPNMQTEFISDMKKNKPAIIVIANENGRYDFLPEWYSPVYDMIENEYSLFLESDVYFLFKRNL